MKRYTAEIISEHADGALVLYEDAEAYAKAQVEAEREEIIELIRMLSGIQLMQAIRARGAKA